MTCLVNETELIMMIDSGADACAIGHETWNELWRTSGENPAAFDRLKSASESTNLYAFAASQPLKVLLSFCANLFLPETGKATQAEMFVVRGATRSILARDTAIALGVLQLGASINSCEVFAKPFPKAPGEQVHFDVDPLVVPTKNAYYNVPAAFRSQACDRLRQMERQQIIEQVVRAPKWISGMTLVPKGKDDFRLVVNMRGPNRAIRRAFHPLPTLDEIRVKLNGVKWFAKLDLKSAFHHLELDEESRELTTFQTEQGMRRFTRLVFGVNCAPEIFQRFMERILEGLRGVVVFIDDVLVYAESQVQLQERTKSVLKVLADNNLTLNEEKCVFEQQEIQFLGHRLSKNGFEVDKAKVDDVVSFQRPESATDLRSFLGLAAYLKEYIQNYSNLVDPMWKLLSSATLNWTAKAEHAFEETKRRIAGCTIKLGFFSPTDKTVLYTDASPQALGAVLCQEASCGKHRTICFASKSLTPTERAYPQIQKEALAIVWAVERFYFYLMGSSKLLLVFP